MDIRTIEEYAINTMVTYDRARELRWTFDVDELPPPPSFLATYIGYLHYPERGGWHLVEGLSLISSIHFHLCLYRRACIRHHTVTGITVVPACAWSIHCLPNHRVESLPCRVVVFC